jgi:hypothetical protein
MGFCIICAELTVVIKLGKTWVEHVAGVMDLICEYCFGQKTEDRKASWGVRFRLENNVEFRKWEQCHTGNHSVLGSSLTSEKLNLLSS